MLRKVLWSSLSSLQTGRKGWFFGGAALGLATPVGIQAYEKALMLGWLHPLARLLCWPTSFFLLPINNDALAMLFAYFANSLLYALIAVWLRRASIAVLLVMLLVIWFYVPLSDGMLARLFAQHRQQFEKVIQMSDVDHTLVELTPNRVKTKDEKNYTAVDSEGVLPHKRWDEYRRVLAAAKLQGFYRSPATGQTFLVARASDAFGPFATYYGFLYCRSSRPGLSGYLACREREESMERPEFRYRRLESDWYSYKVFLKWWY
jgi:hypothetical protein